MCAPNTFETVKRELSRRKFLVAGATLAATATAKPPERPIQFPAFKRVVDLTHTYTADFPDYVHGKARLKREVLASRKQGKLANAYRWSFDEHCATHIDAPVHFSERDSVEKIPAADLVCPLAVINIAARAERNPNAQLTLADVKKWEAKHGPIPRGACVAIYSGWERHVKTKKFLGDDGTRTFHFPGFHIEAIEYFIERRHVKGIALDTPSLDHGPDRKYPVHLRWLGLNRWGLENVAHLAAVPAKGATLVAAPMKIQGATGGPTRIYALV